NLFWDVHPAKLKLMPGQWLTATVAPQIAELGGGLGYSFIAESYLNFGTIGFLLCGILGAALVAMTQWVTRVEPETLDLAKVGVVAVLLSCGLQYARGDVFIFFRTFVWYGVMPY